MTEKELRELITIKIGGLDYVTLVAKTDADTYRMSWGWNGVEFRILITKDNSSYRQAYSTKSVIHIYRDLVNIINLNCLKVNHIKYVLNSEHAIILYHQIEDNQHAYVFATEMPKIDELHVKFKALMNNYDYKQAVINFSAFIHELKTIYYELKITIISPTPMQILRKRKIESLYGDFL
ncbi:MAG TPA: hypothetical protein PK758_14565 [Tenuifilaceae bacterium]|nr:hypothetical protein [Tenuifilaceae bacterium]